jgi:hypothetical protein
LLFSWKILVDVKKKETPHRKTNEQPGEFKRLEEASLINRKRAQVSRIRTIDLVSILNDFVDRVC